MPRASLYLPDAWKGQICVALMCHNATALPSPVAPLPLLGPRTLQACRADRPTIPMSHHPAKLYASGVKAAREE
eukprot:14537474-Alexandrium_andersonii.AAC.1